MSDEVNNGNNGTAPRDREPEIQSFKCPNCGGIMKWNIKKRGFMCSSCGTPGELDTDNKKVLEHPLSQYHLGHKHFGQFGRRERALKRAPRHILQDLRQPDRV